MKKYFLMLLMAAALALMPSVVYPADVKVTALPGATSVTNDDLLMVVDAPGGTPTSKKITIDNFFTSGGTLAQGDTFYWDTTAKALTKGSTGSILRAGSTLPAWSSSTFADTYLKGSILYNATANTVSGLAHPGAANYIMYSSGTDTIGWLPSSTNMITLLGSATYETARESLGVKIGTDVQAYNANAVEGPTTPTAGYLTKWDATGHKIVDGAKLGTLTDSKWCSYTTADGLKCTESTPVGAGDVTDVGDCSTGACYDGSSDGGTYVRLYDGNSHYTQLSPGDSSANLTFTFPTAYPAGTYLMTVGTGGAMSYVNPTSYQAADADLTTYAGITPSANIQTFLGSATYEAARENLGLAIGTDVQAYNSNLTAINQALTTTSTPTFAGVNITPATTTGGYTTLLEGSNNGSNFRKISVPAALSADLELRYPNTVPTDSQVLVFSAPTDGISEGVWTDMNSGAGDFMADGSVPMTAAPVPNAANTVAIGSATAEWADIYLGDGAIIYGQNDQSNTITSSATGWTFAKPITVADVTNDNYIKITNNASRAATASVNEIYPEANVFKMNQNGTEYSVALGPTATQINFSGTLTDGRLCTFSTGGSIACDTEVSAGGDITAVGSCTTGSCATIGNGATSAGYIDLLEDSDNGTNYARIQAPASTADVVLTLPAVTDTLAVKGANTFTALQTMDATAGVQVGSTGVLITSDNDGAITFTGASAGADEDLTINLDDTANTAVVSSSTGVTDVSFSALNLVTTGTVSGKIPMISKTSAYTLGTDNAQEAYGYMVWLTGDGTVLTLPAVTAGMSVCVYSADSYDKVVDPNGSDGIRNGTTTRNADGHKITSGATDQGSFVCLVADSADGWTVLGKSGTWTDE